jgi:hypothetical protein
VATSNKDLKAIMAARRDGRLKPTPVPQVDPVEAIGVLAASPEPAAAPLPTPAAITQAPVQPAVQEAATSQPPAEPAAFNPFTMLVHVDTTERLRMAGFHMYPSRHEQLQQLAFLEKRKQWQIVEDALADYVKKHYGKKKSA